VLQIFRTKHKNCGSETGPPTLIFHQGMSPDNTRSIRPWGGTWLWLHCAFASSEDTQGEVALFWLGGEQIFRARLKQKEYTGYFATKVRNEFSSFGKLMPSQCIKHVLFNWKACWFQKLQIVKVHLRNKLHLIQQLWDPRRH